VSEVSGTVDLKPHDLVENLTKGLGESGPEGFRAAVAAASTAEEFASAYATSSDVPETVTFVGFLGATFPRDSKEWCVLYLDRQLATWLLVEKDGIACREEIKDDAAPSGKHDEIWVRANAAVGIGRGSPSNEAKFLTGDFTRAADFEAPPTGGTVMAATGVFCQARTAGCCHRKSS